MKEVFSALQAAGWMERPLLALPPQSRGGHAPQDRAASFTKTGLGPGLACGFHFADPPSRIRRDRPLVLP